MAVSYSSGRVNVNGAYATGSCDANTDTSQIVGSGFTSDYVGRFVAVYPGGSVPSDTSTLEIRLVTAASATVLTVHYPFSTAPTTGDTFRVSHNCEDVHAIGDSNLNKIGESTYRWLGDWSVDSTGFFGDIDVNLEMRSGLGNAWSLSSGALVQFGVLWGAEGTDATETTNGCRLVFDARRNNQNVYSGTNSRDGAGAVVNYYGCLVESQATTWMFQRMRGPTRFIGSVFDGPMGGRFYHEGSEWADCRMSGNDDLTPAWSIGATFTRPIQNIATFRNLACFKSYLSFGGTFRDVKASNNNIFFSRNGNGTVDFIDSTEFDSSDLSGASGTLRQFRSININTTDDTGAALDGVAIRVNNKDDLTQGDVQLSSGGGLTNEILAQRFRHNPGSTTLFSFAPFRIRIRAYGYLWASLNAAVADPINQSFAMIEDMSVTQSSAVAAAHVGISVADTSPVSWQGKDWSITVTVDQVANPGATLEDVKHYLHYHLSQTSSFEGKDSGLHWHNLIPMSGTETERGSYGGVFKGVRVIDQNGDPFPGVTRMQADDGTYYVPPIQYSLTLTGLNPNTEVRIYEAGTTNELGGVENSGTSFTYNYSYTADFDVDIRIAALSYINQSILGLTLTSSNTSIPIQQVTDRNYKNPI